MGAIVKRVVEYWARHNLKFKQGDWVVSAREYSTWTRDPTYEVSFD